VVQARGSELHFAAAASFCSCCAAILQLQCAVLQPLPAFAAGPAANFAGWKPVARPILQPVPPAAGAAPLVTPAISVSSHSPESGGIGPSVGPLKLKQMEDETDQESVPLGREISTLWHCHHRR